MPVPHFCAPRCNIGVDINGVQRLTFVIAFMSLW